MRYHLTDEFVLFPAAGAKREIQCHNGSVLISFEDATVGASAEDNRERGTRLEESEFVPVVANKFFWARKRTSGDAVISVEAVE